MILYMKPTLSNSGRLRVLTYHRIADINKDPGGDPQLISATPSNFERQMAHLAGHYNVVSAKDILDAIDKRSPLANRAVFISFDDAYRDFKTNAWPILKKFGFSATLFVPTAFPDHSEKSFWWDKLHDSILNSSKVELYLPSFGSLPLNSYENRIKSLRHLQRHIKNIAHLNAVATVDEICSQLGSPQVTGNNVLSWHELRQLAKEGVELGSHTQTHPILTRLPIEKIRAEAVGSYRDLKREIGNVLPIISYPNGNCDIKIAEVFQQEGFKLGFTTQDGHNDLGVTNQLLMCRTNITRKTTPFLFRLRLMRLSPNIDRWRHRANRTIG